jgi:hypothetical protein
MEYFEHGLEYSGHKLFHVGFTAKLALADIGGSMLRLLLKNYFRLSLCNLLAKECAKLL